MNVTLVKLDAPEFASIPWDLSIVHARLVTNWVPIIEVVKVSVSIVYLEIYIHNLQTLTNVYLTLRFVPIFASTQSAVTNVAANLVMKQLELKMTSHV